MKPFRKKKIELERRLFEYTINLKVEFLDKGLYVLLIGGACTHIGAVSIVDEHGQMQTIAFPGHKEYLITERWSQHLYAGTKEAVSLTAGIHYDHLSKQEIEVVMQTVDEMFENYMQLTGLCTKL